MDDVEQFQREELSVQECDFVKKVLERYILGVYIARSTGGILYSFLVDPSIRVDLISNFIAALSMFGEENLGKIKRIHVEGLQVEMGIVSKHDLICTAFYRPNMVKDYLQEEVEKLLDEFSEKFRKELDADIVNQTRYESFDDFMFEIIQEYLVRIKVLEIAGCTDEDDE